MQNELEKFISNNREAFDDEEPDSQVWKGLEKKFANDAAKQNIMRQIELEKFIQANREAFDDDEPSAQVWKNLEKKFGNNDASVITINRRLFVRTLSIAAAFIIVAVGAWLLVKNSGSNTNNTVAAVTTPASTDTQQIQHPLVKSPMTDSVQTVAVPKNTAPELAETTADNKIVNDNSNSEELYYYTKLTEIKFKQLKTIEKEEPALYHNFSTEIQKLDSTYHSLKALLASNADKEAVLNAMLTNLKIETEVLNKQLAIIKTIKQSKKKQYENDFKSM